jgi:hypothetical protein
MVAVSTSWSRMSMPKSCPPRPTFTAAAADGRIAPGKYMGT